MELNEKYIHIKSGNPYTLITDSFMFKENGEWRKGLCLYRADYDNPNGPYFARTREDFFEHFKKKEESEIKAKEELEIKASEITNGNMLVAAGVSKINVEIDDNEIIKGTWIKPEDEKPEKPGYYHVLTDDHLARGIAWYGEDLYADEVEEGVYDFFVEWAEYGNSEQEPKVAYWLKDSMWGLLYKFKKEKGEI